MATTSPKKQPVIDWDEFDKLLIPEKPTSEWVSSREIRARYGEQFGSGDKFERLRKVLDHKRFLDTDGKWRNYYRIKK